MGVFTRISQNTFNELQLDAGVLLKTFDPTNVGEPDDDDIIGATTGGINAVCTPTFSDFGEDIDNVPNNTKELKHLDGWECTFGTTLLNMTEDSIKLSLGVADAENGKITPRRDLSQSDFEDAIWWVGDRTDGGLVAIKLMNVLSTGGFSLQTTKNGKGQLAITLMGHVSIDEQTTMPMEFYVAEGSGTEGNTEGDTEGTT